MAYTFDGPNKLVILTTGTVLVDVDDLYSRWVDWWLTGENSKYVPAMRNVGGDPLTETKALGATYFMTNGWRIRPQEANHWLTVNGNLWTDPSGYSPFVATVGAYNVTISLSVSNLAEASNSSEVAAAVWDDPAGVEASLTPRGAMRLMAAVLAGKVSGAPAGPVLIRNVGDTVTRVVATVDGNGNRTAVTVDAE